MAVDQNISDLWFNTDLDQTKVTGKDGVFIEYDEDKLHGEAVIFLACLERLNVAVPTPAELIENFYARL